MSETTPAPQRTEETMPPEIGAALDMYEEAAISLGSAPDFSPEEQAAAAMADRRRFALEAAILRALRSPAPARCACTHEAGDSPCPVHGMDEAAPHNPQSEESSR